MDITSLIKPKKAEFEAYLNLLITSNNHFETEIVEAMNYSLKSGGKRMRAILLIEACRNCGGTFDQAKAHAAAIEMIHTYSLIHDDLPSMDNDDYRRGKLTNHKVFGEAIAILAGDGLLNLAYELMIQATLESQTPERYLTATKIIANAAGYRGMIGGQVIDIRSENSLIDKQTISYIHEHKTASLIAAPIVAGATIAGADDELRTHYQQYGHHLGMAFQVIDDILDVTGDSTKLGKPIGSDVDNDKMTYPKLFGLEKSRDIAKDHTEQALIALSNIKLNSQFLISLTKALLNRQY